MEHNQKYYKSHIFVTNEANTSNLWHLKLLSFMMQLAQVGCVILQKKNQIMLLIAN